MLWGVRTNTRRAAEAAAAAGRAQNGYEWQAKRREGEKRKEKEDRKKEKSLVHLSNMKELTNE